MATLRTGSSGSEVTALQNQLVALGYDLGDFGANGDGVDGKFGPATAAAVKGYQADNGLTVDGIIGPNTSGALAAATPDTAATDTPDTEPNGTVPDPGRTDDPAFDQTATIDSGPAGTDTLGIKDIEATIPSGMRLIKVSGPSGSDADALYYAVGTIFGVEIAYEIGDAATLDAMFGGREAFNEWQYITQDQFDNLDITTVGSIDEIVGATESLQAQYERDLREAGMESPPPWMAGDKKAMTIFITGVNEGWTPERTWNELSSLGSFKERFDGLDVVMSQLGVNTFTEGVSAFIQRETEIRAALVASRGPATDTSQGYVTSLIKAGWQTAEVGELLALEKRVKNDPEALDNINEILAYQGLDTLNPDDFVSFLQDQDALTLDPSFTPSDMFEAVNDALRFQALLTEGLDVSLEFATELGAGTSDTILSEERFSQQAQLAAATIAKNMREIDMGKLGLDREDVIAAMFGEARDGGKSVAEVSGILEQFGRERSAAAQGYARSTAFVNKDGRLVTQGFSDI